jgi:hypothetical protein
MPDWDTLPRLLQELCGGCPNIRAEVYGYDLPNGHRLWLCKSCYLEETSPPPIRIDLAAVSAARRGGTRDA